MKPSGLEDEMRSRAGGGQVGAEDLLENLWTWCQGITPSNSKGGLPAPEAGTRAEEGGVRDEIDPSPSQLKSSQDKAEPQTAELTQLPEVVEGRARPGGPT